MLLAPKHEHHSQAEPAGTQKNLRDVHAFAHCLDARLCASPHARTHAETRCTHASMRAGVKRRQQIPYGAAAHSWQRLRSWYAQPAAVGWQALRRTPNPTSRRSPPHHRAAGAGAERGTDGQVESWLPSPSPSPSLYQHAPPRPSASNCLFSSVGSSVPFVRERSGVRTSQGAANLSFWICTSECNVMAIQERNKLRAASCVQFFSHFFFKQLYDTCPRTAW